MKLSIPANWQDDFLDRIDFSSVYEVYGKLPGDFVGGGRASVIFKNVSSNTFKTQVRKIRDMGISFNYLLNATCLDNLEFTRKGNRQIKRLLRQITDAGVDTVTIALPQLIPMIRGKYPDMRISVSTNNMVNNLERAKLYENIGIEHFKLAERGMNTDDLALIVNAYTQRSYEGNFMDLIPSMSKYEYITNPSTGHFMKYLGQFRKVGLKTIRKSLKAVMALKDLSAFYKDMGIYIDNKSLVGFAKYFTTHHCQETVCEECAYCDKWAEKVVHIKDEKQRDHAVQVFENILSTLTSDALY